MFSATIFFLYIPPALVPCRLVGTILPLKTVQFLAISSHVGSYMLPSALAPPFHVNPHQPPPHMYMNSSRPRSGPFLSYSGFPSPRLDFLGVCRPAEGWCFASLANKSRNQHIHSILASSLFRFLYNIMTSINKKKAKAIDAIRYFIFVYYHQHFVPDTFYPPTPILFTPLHPGLLNLSIAYLIFADGGGSLTEDSEERSSTIHPEFPPTPSDKLSPSLGSGSHHCLSLVFLRGVLPTVYQYPITCLFLSSSRS